MVPAVDEGADGAMGLCGFASAKMSEIPAGPAGVADDMQVGVWWRRRAGGHLHGGGG